jgi:nucleoside-diphosphate-sugar epimerase
MRAFVTGGSGFLGRNLIAALKERGYEVRALARTPDAAEEVRRAGAEPVMGDLDDGAALRSGMEGCDVVFHGAAKLGDWGEYKDFHKVNVLGTERVLAAARAAKVPRLVHVSTEAVLVGEDVPLIVNADETWPRPRKPIGLYPKTKGLAEARVLAANSPELATVVVRPRLIWGQDGGTVLADIAKMVSEGKFMWIGGGRCLTSTCHVENVCEGMILAAEKGRGGEIYFLTDGPPVEVRSFLTTMLRARGVEPGNKSIPRWVAGALAWGSERAWRALKLKGSPPATRTAVRLIGDEVTVNDSKARRELGYTSHMSREAGLAEMSTYSKEEASTPRAPQPV